MSKEDYYLKEFRCCPYCGGEKRDDDSEWMYNHVVGCELHTSVLAGTQERSPSNEKFEACKALLESVVREEYWHTQDTLRKDGWSKSVDIFVPFAKVFIEWKDTWDDPEDNAGYQALCLIKDLCDLLDIDTGYRDSPEWGDWKLDREWKDE